MWLSLDSTYIDVNTVLGLPWIWWTGILFQYSDCSISVCEISFVLLILLCLLPSWLWWVKSTSLCIHYSYLPGWLDFCGRWWIYCLWIPPYMQLNITSGYKWAIIVVCWARCMIFWPLLVDGVGLTLMYALLWSFYCMLKWWGRGWWGVWNFVNFLF